MLTKEESVLTNKGHDYACDEDRLSNFKMLGQLLGLDPIQVWGVYCFKHLLAVASYVKHGQVESEPIEERILDVRNYMVLGRALIQEIHESDSGSEAEDSPNRTSDAFMRMESEIRELKKTVEEQDMQLQYYKNAHQGPGGCVYT